MEISSEAAAFLSFIDACTQGAEAIKARFTEPLNAHLASTGQESFYALIASQGSAFASCVDRSSARVLPYDGEPTWAKQYVVSATRGGITGTLCFVGAFHGSLLGGAATGAGIVFTAEATTDTFSRQRPRLVYKPLEWVTIRASLVMHGDVSAAPVEEAGAEAAAFLSFIDACTQGAEAIKARFTEPLNAHLASTGQESFYALIASQGSAFASCVDRSSARVLPYDGEPTWAKQYVVSATRGGITGTLCFVGAFHGSLLGGAATGGGIVFTAEPAAAPMGSKQEPTSHYLVIAPLPRSMEQDGVPRYALYEAKIECEGKQDVPGLKHYVAAVVPATQLMNLTILHRFVRVATQLIGDDDAVPAGWRSTPAVHGCGHWGKAPDTFAIDVVRASEKLDVLTKLAAEHGFAHRSEEESDWHYARRAQQYLCSRVRYDAAAAGSANAGKSPAHCLSTRVAHCGNFSSAYRELLSFGGVLCQSAIGEWICERGKCHCVNDVFLEDCGWIPVEPAGNGAIYDKNPSEWGPPSFISPSFGVADDMLICDQGWREYHTGAVHANDSRILFGSSAGEKAEPASVAEAIFKRFDADNSGTLDKSEARQMLATMLGIHEHWPGASDALNAAAAALDLDQDGTISREELLAGIEKGDNAAAHLLASASQQVNMGQNVVQLRPLTLEAGLGEGAWIRDGVVCGTAGMPIPCVGHGLMAQYESSNFTAGKMWLEELRARPHVVVNESDAKGGCCAARQPIDDEEASELFAKIEARCKELYARQ